MFGGSKFSLQVKIDALEQKGLLRTLAEPNLVALSGETASFLAGGEFPIPVAQATAASSTGGLGTITVEFKDFGVGLGSHTDRVIGKDLIKSGLVNTEGQFDRSNALGR